MYLIKMCPPDLKAEDVFMAQAKAVLDSVYTYKYLFKDNVHGSVSLLTDNYVTNILGEE